jgi:hypothetical protein
MHRNPQVYSQKIFTKPKANRNIKNLKNSIKEENNLTQLKARKAKEAGHTNH